jgi:1-acyl-sn-glycerol-3-phosphate acyltransferase
MLNSKKAKELAIKLTEYILLPFRIFYKIYLLLFFTILLLLLYPILCVLLAKPLWFPIAFKVMRVQAFLILVFGVVYLKVKGRNNIPKHGPFIICPNHSSYLDIPCLYVLFRKYFVFTGKREIEKWPLFHIYYTSGMNILVDRGSSSGSVALLKRMSQEIDKGLPLMIFPEGTISKHAPKLVPFKSGAFAIAIQKQIPILPVTFLSNWKRLQRSGIWNGKAGPGISEVIIHKPIITNGLNKSHIDQLCNEVQKMVNEPLLYIDARMT